MLLPKRATVFGITRGNHFNDTRPIQQDATLAVGGKGVNLLRYIPHQQVYVWRVRENAIVKQKMLIK